MNEVTKRIELDVEYPAHTPKPAPSRAGVMVHSLMDISMYFGTEMQTRLYAAKSEEEEIEALKAMPLATVKFYELPEGEPFFDDVDEFYEDESQPTLIN